MGSGMGGESENDERILASCEPLSLAGLDAVLNNKISGQLNIFE